MEKRDIPIYYFRITPPTPDELQPTLDTLDWPPQSGDMQKNWIGKGFG